MNSELEIQLRRYKHNLAIGGRFYIIFGIWDVIKITLLLTMGGIVREAAAGLPTAGEDDLLFFYLIIAVLTLIVSVFIMIMHLTVGRTAIRLGRDQKNRKSFYVFTVLATIITVTGVSADLHESIDNFSIYGMVLIASLLVDFSVIYLLVNLIYSSIKIEMITKQLDSGKNGPAQEVA